VHALVPAGILKDGVFHELTRISSPVIAGLFRARLLKVLLDEGVISQRIVDLLLAWNHHSGFNVHARGRIHGADRKAIENVARYMSRAALSAPYESLTYYYGVYSSSYRGKQSRENKEEQETELVLINTGKGTAGGKPTSTWARLIHRIFEVDPLRCSKCGAEMRIIAFVMDFRQVSRILEHIGEQTIRPPPLTAKTSPPGLSQAEAVDYIPRPGNVRPKTRGSAPAGSGSRQNPST
jgi:hypothetical protein